MDDVIIASRLFFNCTERVFIPFVDSETGVGVFKAKRWFNLISCPETQSKWGLSLLWKITACSITAWSIDHNVSLIKSRPPVQNYWRQHTYTFCTCSTFTFCKLFRRGGDSWGGRIVSSYWSSIHAAVGILPPKRSRHSVIFLPSAPTRRHFTPGLDLI